MNEDQYTLDYNLHGPQAKWPQIKNVGDLVSLALPKKAHQQNIQANKFSKLFKKEHEF